MKKKNNENKIQDAPIGVWCVNRTGEDPDNRHELISFDRWNPAEHSHPECIAVVTKEASFIVGLHNTIVAQWGVPTESGKFVTDVNSLDSKAATDAIIDASRGQIWHDYDGDDEYDFVGSPAAEFCRRYETSGIGSGKWDLPTLAQLKFVSRYRKEINRCRRAMGFPAMIMGFYWSSIACGYSLSDAWGVGMDLGYVYGNDKYRTHYVLAVSAFQNLNL